MAPASGSSRRVVASDSEDTEDEQTTQTQNNRTGNSSNHANGHRKPDDEYQPGAIVRVKLLNFVTYEDAVFYPGPNLNMVIGPNGTGKSSLVCAICIGLGYATVNLGRAAKFGEFVKHGKDDAVIEIELQRKPTDASNYTIKVKVVRDGDKRKWWINGSETSLKNVQNLVKNLGIQVDNLCQFLPQDRVSEFAGLSPIELLHETQRAAAPPEMLSWHEELKGLRKEQKALQLNLEGDQENLTVQEERNEGLRGDVERLQERADIQHKIQLLEKSFPFVEYREARKEYHASRDRHVEAKNQLRHLEAEVAPTLQAVNLKQEYAGLIQVVVNERKAELRNAERAAASYSSKLEQADSSIENVEQQKVAESEAEKMRVQRLASIRRKIRDLEAQQLNAPPVFEAQEWNAKIRAEEHRQRELDAELRRLNEQVDDMKRQGQELKQASLKVTADIHAMESQDGKNVTKLRNIAPETARAWEWIISNRDKFEKEVFGPPLISCSVKDPRCADLLESLLQKSDFMTITAQTSEDFRTLSNQLYETMRLADITLRTSRVPLTTQRIMPQEQLRSLGLDGWAIDYLEGPEPVLSMLCSNNRLDKTAVALADISDAQYNAIIQTPIGRFAAGNSMYQITRRPEYGPEATSTSSKAIGRARFWTDAPVDTTAKMALEQKSRELQERFEQLRSDILAPRERQDQIRQEKTEALQKIDSLRVGKNNAQTAYGIFCAIPAKLENQRELEQNKKEAGTQYRARLSAFQRQIDELIIKKNEITFEYKAAVEAIREAHRSLQEASMRLLQAESDVEVLKDRNAGIARRLQECRQEVEASIAHKDAAKTRAHRALAISTQIIEEVNDQDRAHFNSLDPELTAEQLSHDIDAERAKLDYIQVDDPGALRQFEEREKAIEHLQNKIATSQAKLDELNARIDELRASWEPKLDELIGEISAAFANNFERIGCAGEVGVHKDPDFDLWSIEIKVKFRENETLQLLDQHRQSGGERSVSTIFYLMALQSLARSPFRVVDEINQGMDPRNERMVHERMVEIACKEHTSQYFLITPKLLTNLRYDRRMKVLCIASGEHMPADHTGLDIKRVIEMRRQQRRLLMV